MSSLQKDVSESLRIDDWTSGDIRRYACDIKRYAGNINGYAGDIDRCDGDIERRYAAVSEAAHPGIDLPAHPGIDLPAHPTNTRAPTPATFAELMPMRSQWSQSPRSQSVMSAEDIEASKAPLMDHLIECVRG